MNEPWNPDDMAYRPDGLTVDQTLEKMSVNAREVGLDYEREKAQEPFGSVADTDLQGFISDDYSHIFVYPKGSYPEGGVDLYTAPPKREWVSLSKKEVQEIFDMDLGVYESIEETMRQLEEKNQ